MKDYSKYFQNIESSDIDSSYGFITKLEIVGDEVHIWTPKTKKGEPRKYGIEQLPYFLEKLENQYQEIIDNQEVIKKDYMKPIKKLIITTLIMCILPLTVIGINLMLANSIIKGLIILIGSYLGGMALSIYSYLKKELNFENEMAIYKEFINKRTEIESLSKNDKNITENLNRSTTESIISKEVLKDNGTVSQVYDIDFMDKTSLKELGKLIENYNQSKSLFEEQAFVNPNEAKTKEENGRAKTLKK